MLLFSFSVYQPFGLFRICLSAIPPRNDSRNVEHIFDVFVSPQPLLSAQPEHSHCISFNNLVKCEKCYYASDCLALQWHCGWRNFSKIHQESVRIAMLSITQLLTIYEIKHTALLFCIQNTGEIQNLILAQAVKRKTMANKNSQKNEWISRGYFVHLLSVFSFVVYEMPSNFLNN